ncbi:MAG: prepilin-type N-terminal cleavage/methylation domain-containing protein [Bdellovibrionales bacterium]|nr:prepilin-type N-terminal cleavage/methylation domain-containing protein [Bdellovibrionales bacterium]
MRATNQSGVTLLELLIAGVIAGILFVAYQYFTGPSSVGISGESMQVGEATYSPVVGQNQEVLRQWARLGRTGSRSPANILQLKEEIAQAVGIKPEHVVLYVNSNGSAIAAGGLFVGEKNIVLKPKAILTRTGEWIKIPAVEYKKSDSAPPTYFNNVTFLGVWNHQGTERVVLIRRDDTGGMFKGKKFPYSYVHHFAVDGVDWESQLTLGKTLKGWNTLRGTVRSDAGESLELVAHVMPVELTEYGRTPPTSTIGGESMITYAP